jgi:hypothetical protein
MNVNIYTPDSKMPNLAAMKISAYHKQIGDRVTLNRPYFSGMNADLTYASVLFRGTPEKEYPAADLVGGPAFPESKLPPEMDTMKPDYALYPGIDYSMGYTYKACPRTCEHCIVPKQQNDDKHYSIWDFHETRFKKIMLMNNNTFADPNWRDTFAEIADAKLTVIEHGFDARYVGKEQAQAIKNLKREGYIHFAWDYPEHEEDVLRGLCHLRTAKVSKVMVYVMIGHTTPEEDLHRVLILDAMGFDPYVMPLDKSNEYQRKFQRWCNAKQVFNKPVRWQDYKG